MAPTLLMYGQENVEKNKTGNSITRDKTKATELIQN